MTDHVPLRLAVIGCGAVAELSHLPALAASDAFKLTHLVDTNLTRARALAHKFGVRDVADDYSQIVGKVDAAIVALPHSLHAPVSAALLAAGIHVLVEKPMATRIEECEAMIEAGAKSGAVLAVGLMRRHYATCQFVKRLIAHGVLGDIRSFDVREGMVYNWPVASDFFFRRETAGGGVLIDTGAHTLDLLLWWLGDYDSVTYYDDSMGGVEADCELHVCLKTGASGVVELSRTRNLRNTFVLRGSRAVLEVGTGLGSSVSLAPTDGDIALCGSVSWTSGVIETPQVVMRRQLDDFAEVICQGRNPLVTGEDGMRSVALIEDCYTSRLPLDQPWLCPDEIRGNAGGEEARGKHDEH